MTAKILFFDIETSPSLAYVWQAYDANVISFERDWDILSFAWKWLGDKEVQVLGQDDDNTLIEKLWELFDKADVIVAHNCDAFDVKKSNTMFLLHGLQPPRPYKTVDTLKVAKKYFKFDRNNLNELARYLGLGEKRDNPGFKMWLGCIKGDPESWKLMKEYNKHDVLLLEQVYLALRPWHSGHPNLNLYDGEEACPTCGSESFHRRGFSYAKVQIRQRFHCNDCGAWWSGKVVKKSVL